MKTIASSLITGLALAVSAFHSTAQDTNHQPPAHPANSANGQSPIRHRPVPTLILAALDADQDGVISAQEITGASTALMKLDKNNDRQLTGDEVFPGRRNPRPAGAAGKPSMDAGSKPQGSKLQPSPLMAALDTDGDGTLSPQEIANASAALRTLDKNKDGQLTRDEYRSSRPRSAGRRVDDGKAKQQDQPSTGTETRPITSRARAAGK